MRNNTAFRTVVQLLSLAVFCFLLFCAAYPLRPGVPCDLFLRMDPLVALGAALGAREFPGRILLCLWVVALTLIAGRLFCGYLCPCGTVIDLSDGIASRHRRISPGKNRRYRRLRNAKFHFLLILLVAGSLGFGLLHAFDPISLLTRTFSFIVYPLAVFLANQALGLLRPVAEILGFVELAHARYAQPVIRGNLAVLGMFAGVLALAVFSRRFWCRYLCPLGALLGIFSWMALIRRRVSEGCTACGRCQAACPMDAIKQDPTMTVQSECIGCRACAKVCPENVVSFSWRPLSGESYRSEVAVSRRAFVYSAGGALFLSFLNRTIPASAEGSRLLRPPGALPEAWFNETCIRCGECVKACVTHTLQPCLLEAGLDGLWTPRCVMRLAGCEPSCNVCGHVCPTQAIRALSLEEKKYARIGTAKLLRRRCIAWEQGRLCLVCDEACPYNAIVFKVVGGHKRPFVDERKCKGCGICEQACPVTGESAIVVSPVGQIRLKEGSFKDVVRRIDLELKGKAEQDEIDEIFLPSSEKELISEGPVRKDGRPILPPGFVP